MADASKMTTLRSLAAGLDFFLSIMSILFFKFDSLNQLLME
ncbi:MAG: hypothetical protein BWY95_02503 [Bacteroidetes bacterium ADurb.BinA104]|nr:MAG: hypothetical protein BWY95_02503 [Bacteroidetes bacterium ADurb.BinA104]